MTRKTSVVVLVFVGVAAWCLHAVAQAPLALEGPSKTPMEQGGGAGGSFSSSLCDQISQGTQDIVRISSEWNAGVFVDVVEHGLKAGKNLDEAATALNPGTGSPKLWWAGKIIGGLDLLYKGNKARQQPTWRDTGAMAISEGAKWLAGNYVGGGLATYIIVGGPGWAVLVAIPVAWAGVLATEKLIEVAPPWIARKFSEFCKTRMAKEFSNFVQPILLSGAEWLGIITPSGMTLESMNGSQIVIPIDATPEQINQILAGNPSFNPSGPNAMETILDNLPPGVTTEADLEKYLQPKPGTPPDIAEAHNKYYVPAVKKAFAERRTRWERDFVAATASSLELTVSPNPAAIDPKTGTAVVTVTSIDGDLSSNVETLRRNIRRLTGNTPSVNVFDYWTGPDGKPHAVAWSGTGQQQYEIKTPGKYSVALRRVIRTNISSARGNTLSADSLLRQKIVLDARVAFEVKPLEFPTEIAGRWTGTFVIREIPLLNQLKAGPPQPGADADPDNPFGALGEGCSIPPEMFAQIVKELEKIKGQAMVLNFDIQPESIFAGRITLSVTPPRGSRAEGGEPQTFPYRYANGVITVEGGKDKMSMQMQGTFAPAAPGWTLNGSWEAYGHEKGKRILGMTGTWSGTNPNAK